MLTGHALLAAAGCGAHQRPPAAHPTVAAAHANSPPRRAQPRPPRLRLLADRSLPAPVQLPALAFRGGEVLALGGLDAADTSVASLVRVAPDAPQLEGAMSLAVHDAGASTPGGSAYVFGAGTAAGASDAIVAVGRDGGAHAVGRLPGPSSDLDGSRGVLSFDPASRRARRIARRPHPLGHAAGEVLGRYLFVLGGRDDSFTGKRRSIRASDPHSGRGRSAERLPVALSDLSAVTVHGRVPVAGGRDRSGRVC